MNDSIPAFALVLVAPPSGEGPRCFGETVSRHDPETGHTYVRLLPGRAWSAVWVETSRLIDVSQGGPEHLIDEHLSSWGDL